MIIKLFLIFKIKNIDMAEIRIPISQTNIANELLCKRINKNPIYQNNFGISWYKHLIRQFILYVIPGFWSIVTFVIFNFYTNNKIPIVIITLIIISFYLILSVINLIYKINLLRLHKNIKDNDVVDNGIDQTYVDNGYNGIMKKFTIGQFKYGIRDYRKYEEILYIMGGISDNTMEQIKWVISPMPNPTPNPITRFWPDPQEWNPKCKVPPKSI